MSRGIHHDKLGIIAELVENVRDRNHQRDRRDDQNEQRNDEAGNADEDENALALIRHQVDVAQGLRDPHERGHAGANHQERTERGAENIPADGPHAICASPLAAKPRCAWPPMPATAHRCYSKAFFSLYLIGQQSGLAKAKPLTMHNKTLIRRLCPGRHRRLGEPGPGVGRNSPPGNLREACSSRPHRAENGSISFFPCGRPDFCPLGARLIASAKPASTFPRAEFVHIREEIAPCLAAWSLNLCPSLHPLRAFLSCSAKRGSSSVLSRAVASPQAVISRSGRRRPSGSKARTALRSTWLPRRT